MRMFLDGVTMQLTSLSQGFTFIEGRNILYHKISFRFIPLDFNSNYIRWHCKMSVAVRNTRDSSAALQKLLMHRISMG